MILKTKAHLKEVPDNKNSHPCFLLIDWLSFGEREEGGRIRLKLDVQGQGGGRILEVDGQGGWGVLHEYEAVHSSAQTSSTQT